VNDEQRDGIGCPETLPKCPGRGCDHVMCIEQRRVLEDGSHAMSDDLKGAEEAAAAQLLIALAFTVPAGTDVRQAFGKELLAYRDAVRAAERTAREQAEQNERLALERLSQALTGSNAATWDEVFHAAEQSGQGAALAPRCVPAPPQVALDEAHIIRSNN
jgi:hypothetical protein